MRGVRALEQTVTQGRLTESHAALLVLADAHSAQVQLIVDLILGLIEGKAAVLAMAQIVVVAQPRNPFQGLLTDLFVERIGT